MIVRTQNSESKIKEFFEFCKENEVEFVDFRFSDIKGTWNHIAYSFGALTHGMLKEGFLLMRVVLKAGKALNTPI